MHKQIMFAIAAAVLLTAFVTVASYEMNLAHAQAPPGGAGGNATAGGMAKNATAGNATAGGNMTKK